MINVRRVELKSKFVALIDFNVDAPKNSIKCVLLNRFDCEINEDPYNFFNFLLHIASLKKTLSYNYTM